MAEITVKDLREWLASLPPEADTARVTSCVHGNAFSAKRIVLRRSKDGSDAVLCVNSMGTHLNDDFYINSTEIAPALTPHFI